MSVSKPSTTLDQVLRGHTGIVSSTAFHPTNQIGNCPVEKAAAKDDSADERHDENVDGRKFNLTRHPCQQIASSSSDGTVMIFNIHGQPHRRDQNDALRKDDGRVRAYQFIGHRGPVHRIAYSPSGKVLASCSSDATVRLWSPSRNYSKGDSVVLRGHNGPVRCVDFGSPSVSGFSSDVDDGVGSLLLTASDDKTIKLWSLPKTNFVTSFVGHTNWVRVAKFCQPPSNADDGVNRSTSLAASGGDDRTVRIWSCDRVVNLATYGYFGSRAMGNSGGGVRDLAFLPSGTSLAACGTDGYVRLFDLRSDAVVRNLDCNDNDRSSRPSLSTVDSLSAHPDGIHLLCSTGDSARDGRVLMFDLRSPSDPLFDLPSVNSIGKNGAGDVGGMAPPLRSASGRRRGNAGGGGIPTSAAFSPDGLRFATSLKDNAVRIYRWNDGVCREEATSPMTNNVKMIGTAKVNGGPRNKEKKQARNKVQRQVTNEVVTKDIAHDLHADMTSEEDSRPRESSLPDNTDAPRNAAPTPSLANSSWKYDKDDLPEILSSTLDRMVGQLEILAQTVIMLDRRLTIQESAMDEMRRRQKQVCSICKDEEDGLDSGQKVDTVRRMLQPSCQKSPQMKVPENNLKVESDASLDPSYTSNPRIHEDGDEDTMLSSTIDERVQIIMQRYSSSSKMQQEDHEKSA